MANKAIKYRVYPGTEQSIMFAKTFGCCRKVYSLMLADKIEVYKAAGKFPSKKLAKEQHRLSRKVGSKSGYHIDRDQNAALNILQEGLRVSGQSA